MRGPEGRQPLCVKACGLLRSASALRVTHSPRLVGRWDIFKEMRHAPGRSLADEDGRRYAVLELSE